MGRLEGQAAIIVGASSGMGRATAQAFAAEGARIVVAARRKGELDTLVSELKAAGREALALAADVGKRPDVEAVVQMAGERFGRVDVLVNCAGINTRDRQLARLDPAGWDRVIGINLTGAYHCTRAVLPRMREQKGGLIIHVASISALWGDLSGAAYQASKHGIVGLANATMMEERLNGIRVTVIYPGLCDTPILNNRPVPPTQADRDRMMKPEDIAQACVFAAGLPPRTYVSDLVLMPGALQCNGHSVA
ncbi:MAG TPA: SDR family oxidoreductase [Candidatus Methylomirabilis sp.]|nr:SDR family oxidoreductase [Candidatus Methylomirabilis sp.]